MVKRAKFIKIKGPGESTSLRFDQKFARGPEFGRLLKICPGNGKTWNGLIHNVEYSPFFEFSSQSEAGHVTFSKWTSRS